MDFKLDETHGNFFHHYTMTDPNDGARLADTLNIILLELPKLPPVKDKAGVENLPSIAKWCKFLKEADNPAEKDLIDMLTASEEGIMDAETTLGNISMDRWRWLVQTQIEADKNIATANLHFARKEGIEKGKAEAAREAAKNLLRMGVLTPEQIAEAVSLPLEEVLALREKLSVKEF